MHGTHLVQPTIPVMTLQGSSKEETEGRHSSSSEVVITLSMWFSAVLSHNVTKRKARCCSQ